MTILQHKSQQMMCQDDVIDNKVGHIAAECGRTASARSRLRGLVDKQRQLIREECIHNHTATDITNWVIFQQDVPRTRDDNSSNNSSINHRRGMVMRILSLKRM